MHEFVFYDCRIIESTDVSIPALSSASLYGKGIFTTILIRGGIPFLWERHWRRLESNAEKLKIGLAGFSESEPVTALAEILEKNNVTDGRARITFFDESASKIWPFETDRKTSLLITTGDLRPMSEKFRLSVSPYTVNTLSPL